MNNTNKFAVVTGASTGIGRAVAVELGKQEYFVFLVARSGDKLNKTKELVEQAGGEASVVICNLDNLNFTELVATIKSKTNNVDYLFNIAGIWHGKNEVYAGKNLETFSERVIKNTFNVGLISPVLLSHSLIPLMAKGSSIVNLSGTFESGAKGWLPYFVSKRGIEDFTIGLSEELKEKGINVNCVSPSDTATEEYKKYFPEYAKDAQTPEEVARFVIEVSQKDISGKIFIIKDGKSSEGFHK